VYFLYLLSVVETKAERERERERKRKREIYKVSINTGLPDSRSLGLEMLQNMLGKNIKRD
jgi:hypothetical protein